MYPNSHHFFPHPDNFPSPFLPRLCCYSIVLRCPSTASSVTPLPCICCCSVVRLLCPLCACYAPPVVTTYPTPSTTQVFPFFFLFFFFLQFHFKQFCSQLNLCHVIFAISYELALSDFCFVLESLW